MSESFDITDVDHLTTGTVGEPGKRVFYLQVGSGGQVVSLRLEKTQVAALSAYLTAMLADLPPPGDLTADMGLVEPVVAEWVVGSLGVSYDEDADRIVLVAEELVEEGADAASARFVATREQVAALAAHGAEIVAAGRPPCSLCGQPLDPEGHVCVRLNGHRRRTP
ncbi:MAG: DUF3090 domain-containing protein [Actinomycetota bacterium]|nr:DUF3090 domain-containing protein [Actinomycetota bacterium]